MKILIPMAGQGKRFLRAGYATPKPFMEVDGIPVVEHIVRNFSSQDDFVFGVDEEHLKNEAYRKTLERIAPRANILSIPYQPDGPVAVLRRMFDAFANDEPVIVNYCDFSWSWDYPAFKKAVEANQADGAVLCYRGFHPHLLGPNKYATLDAERLWMKEIREKHTWHGDKQKDWTSSGTYYFGLGKILKEACAEIEMHPEWKINGEFYVSQLYQVLREKKRKVLIHEIPFMLQWGTPEDLEEYNYWSAYFREKEEAPSERPVHDMNALILMAGAGKRFSDAGYKTAKPLIPVSGSPMVLASAGSLPLGKKYLFAVRTDNPETAGVTSAIRGLFSDVDFFPVGGLTEGQASTALLTKDKLDPEAPLLIGACDHGILFDDQAFMAMTENPDVDALILTFRNFPPVRRNPGAYGWVEADSSGKISRVSVKVPLAGDPMNNHAIIGSFWFRKAGIFFKYAEEMIAENSRVNNEFYIDQCMNFLIRAGRGVHVFEVGRYVSWGTPDDLKVYQYWEMFFTQAWFHPLGKV